MSRELSLQELMTQRFSAQPAPDAVLSPEEAAALEASVTPAPKGLSARPAVADEFTPAGRRVIAPLLKRNGEPSTAVQIKKLNHNHLAMMDFMLANPTASMLDVAKHFNRTLAWTSSVRNADLFRIEYNERRKLITETQRIIIGEKLASMANKGLDALSDALDDEETSVATKLSITRLALEHGGMSSKEESAGPTVTVNLNNAVTITEERRAAVQAARERILNKAQNQHNNRPQLLLVDDYHEKKE